MSEYQLGLRYHLTLQLGVRPARSLYYLPKEEAILSALTADHVLLVSGKNARSEGDEAGPVLRSPNIPYKEIDCRGEDIKHLKSGCQTL